MNILSTQSSQVLAGEIAHAGGFPLIDVTYSRFPDGEVYLRTGEVRGPVLLVGSLFSSDDLIELLLLIDACAEAGDITLLLPYMGYARQDKQFHAGEPLSARAIARALGAGVSRVFTICIHEESILSYFGIVANDIKVTGEISRYISTMPVKNPLILSPDRGAASFAESVAQYCGYESDYLQKTRFSGTEVSIEPKSIPVAGRDVIIVDDIISTGGTQATAAALLYEQGASRLYTICVHGVFTTGAYTHLKAAGFCDVVCTDTIERGCSRISVAPAVLKALGNCS
ncbi:MAG: ribose-phosphate diphosphokinase [Methanospirillaceae archaeon]|nr:ribose-phosphate diphosphokinase [Methanospirillaceae archaeon]